MGKMRAVLREGGMVFKADYPMPAMPKAGSEDVLIRVRGAAINPVDYKAPKMLLGTVVGLDFAGIVEAVAEGTPTHGLNVGDEVYGTAAGSLADLTVADGTRIARKPKSLSFTQTAALPTAHLTGLQALKDHGGLKQGGSALIIGASGGCGLAGVQLARSLGAAQVVGVCSSRNREMVERVGAHRVVDYNTEKIEDIFGNLPDDEKFDVVYDAATGSGAGESYEAASWCVLRQTGHYVPINGGMMTWLRYMIGCQASRKHLFTTNLNRADLDTISRFADEKTFEPIVANTFPFTEEGVEEGFAMLKGRRTVGKIVFDMGQEIAG